MDSLSGWPRIAVLGKQMFVERRATTFLETTTCSGEATPKVYKFIKVVDTTTTTPSRYPPPLPSQLTWDMYGLLLDPVVQEKKNMQMSCTKDHSV